MENAGVASLENDHIATAQRLLTELLELRRQIVKDTGATLALWQPANNINVIHSASPCPSLHQPGLGSNTSGELTGGRMQCFPPFTYFTMYPSGYNFSHLLSCFPYGTGFPQG